MTFILMTAYSWTPADKSRQVPVLAEVSGLSHNSQPTRFHHRYEYFDFRDKIWRDETVFEVSYWNSLFLKLFS